MCRPEQTRLQGVYVATFLLILQYSEVPWARVSRSCTSAVGRSRSRSSRKNSRAGCRASPKPQSARAGSASDGGARRCPARASAGPRAPRSRRPVRAAPPAPCLCSTEEIGSQRCRWHCPGRARSVAAVCRARSDSRRKPQRESRSAGASKRAATPLGPRARTPAGAPETARPRAPRAGTGAYPHGTGVVRPWDSWPRCHGSCVARDRADSSARRDARQRPGTATPRRCRGRPRLARQHTRTAPGRAECQIATCLTQYRPYPTPGLVACGTCPPRARLLHKYPSTAPGACGQRHGAPVENRRRQPRGAACPRAAACSHRHTVPAE